MLWSVGEGGIGAVWTIQLLGGLAARRSQQEVTRFRTQKSAALLAFLAFHAAPNSLPQPRDVLIEMLWPETEHEAGRLEDALAERAVQSDALSEAATGHLKRVLAAMQQPSQALRAYPQLETRLRKELADTPSEALQLYARELRATPPIALPSAGEVAPGRPQPDAVAETTLDVTGAREGGTLARRWDPRSGERSPWSA
jgi:DNA-binding SARP family transcriptional activator